jgi:hypothetical protein
MTHHAYAAVALALISVAIPLRAANRPHAGTDSPDKMVWTNDDLEKLHRLGLISIVGRIDEERPTPASAPGPYVKTQDPEWYAEQAAKLRDELEYRQAQLREYRQALDDARSLRESTGGINLVGEDFAITPEAGIEILQQRVEEAQAEFDDLEDLARRNDIPPGTLRGQ